MKRRQEAENETKKRLEMGWAGKSVLQMLELLPQAKVEREIREENESSLPPTLATTHSSDIQIRGNLPQRSRKRKKGLWIRNCQEGS